MFEEEEFPVEFQNTTLHIIFKGGKGRKEILSDNRFIHCKDFWARTAEGLIVEDGLRGPLIENSSIYQIGGQPGHRPEELVFVMKSIIAKYRKERKKMLIVKLYDISKFFDKETIEDAILTCKKQGADPKAVRLWYKLNESTRIRVKTGSGMSDFTEVGAVLGQGTLGGALISQAVLDEGVMAHIPPGGDLQLEYGSVTLAPVMFQDDLADTSDSLAKARETNQRVDIMTKQLCLDLNRDKTICIIMGSRKQREEISQQLIYNPLMCGKFEMKEKKVDKWLGQYLSCEGLADSVSETVKMRDGKVRGAGLEIAQIVNDWRSHLVGGVMTAVTLWERCCVPSLLHGAGTWVEITPETVKRLNATQQWYWRLIFQVGPGSPLSSLAWDLTCLDMGVRVMQHKVLLALHLRHLDQESLAARVYLEQQAMGWPGLASEVEQICEELNIENANTTKCDKSEYKLILSLACHRKNEDILRALAEGKEKCLRIGNEQYGQKEYLQNKCFSEVRNIYRTRYGQRDFAGNFSKDKKYRKTNWMCHCGQSKEQEIHITSGQCPVYSDIREKYLDFSNDEDLVSYLDEVLARRDLIQAMEQDEKDYKD